jgi:hypothetical protein
MVEGMIDLSNRKPDLRGVRLKLVLVKVFFQSPAKGRALVHKHLPESPELSLSPGLRFRVSLPHVLPNLAQLIKELFLVHAFSSPSHGSCNNVSIGCTEYRRFPPAGAHEPQNTEQGISNVEGI